MIFRVAALLRSDFVGNRRVNQGKSADSAEIHQDDQNKLRKNTELRCDSKGKPDRSDSGRRFVKAGAKRQTFCRADNNAADKNSRKYITATAAAFSLPNRQCACRRLRHRPFCDRRRMHSESERQAWSFSYRLPWSRASRRRA